MGRGEESLLCDPGSELRLQKREEGKKGEGNNGVETKAKKSNTVCASKLIHLQSQPIRILPVMCPEHVQS